MPNNKQLKVKLYGGLRQYYDDDHVLLKLQLPQSYATVKQALLQALVPEAKELIQHCSLASEDKILTEKDKITATQKISALPPVCGG